MPSWSPAGAIRPAFRIDAHDCPLIALLELFKVSVICISSLVRHDLVLPPFSSGTSLLASAPNCFTNPCEDTPTRNDLDNPEKESAGVGHWILLGTWLRQQGKLGINSAAKAAAVAQQINKY